MRTLSPVQKNKKKRENYVKKEIRNILHANIDVHSRRLIAEFTEYGVKCIPKLQSHCANMNFAVKSIYDGIFHKVTNKGGESANELYKDIPECTGFVSFSGKRLFRGSVNAHFLG